MPSLSSHGKTADGARLKLSQTCLKTVRGAKQRRNRQEGTEKDMLCCSGGDGGQKKSLPLGPICRSLGCKFNKDTAIVVYSVMKAMTSSANRTHLSLQPLFCNGIL